jgi:preprotein translocase subunit SecA
MLPNIGEGAFRKEEQKLKEVKQNARIAGGSSEDAPNVSIRTEKKIGRNDIVVITNGTEKKELKYKKALPLLEGGEWSIVKGS